MKVSFSWDDGALEDLKLFELHEKFEIPGMFFVPTKNQEGRDVITPEVIRKAESKYIRFGGHTNNHTYLTNISLCEVEEEIVTNKIYLQNVLGHEVTDFCLPGGKFNSDILDIIYKHYETIRTADTMCFKYNGGVFKPAIHFFPRGIKSLMGNSMKNRDYKRMIYISLHMGMSYFDLITEIIKNETMNKDSVVMIWGHSWELEEYNLWGELEKLMRCEYIKRYAVEYKSMFVNSTL